MVMDSRLIFTLGQIVVQDFAIYIYIIRRVIRKLSDLPPKQVHVLTKQKKLQKTAGMQLFAEVGFAVKCLPFL